MTKTYGYSEAHAIIPSTDGNFFAVGHEGANINLLKIKPSGDTLWTTRYSAKVSDGSSAITPTTDNNFIVTGWRDSIVKYIPGMGFVYHWDAYLLKIKPDGDTLWTKTYGDTDNTWAFAITPTPDGNFIVAGYTQSSAGDQKVFLFSLIDDRYAYKNTLFTFKIPVYDADSLNHGYTPLKIPSGMTVSLGGTISWTPTTDSSYMDHVEFLVSNDMGKKDTLTFNIFVNSKDYPSKVINPTSGLKNQAHRSGISISTFSSYTSFTLPIPTGSLAIYDIHGRLIQTLSFKNNTAIWRGKTPAGRYFAKMTDGKRDVVKPFMVVK